MKEIKINYKQHESIATVSDQTKMLIEKANMICEDAYAPYSKFKVGAAALLDNNEVVLGSNQENIAYPSGLCAERVALFFAGANFPNAEVKELVIVAKGDLVDIEKILSPCGSCRQVMVESEHRQKSPIKVVLVSQNGIIVEFDKATDLLPLAFGQF